MNQNVRNVNDIDWAKVINVNFKLLHWFYVGPCLYLSGHFFLLEQARRTLKGLRVNTVTTNMDCKIVGLSDLPCDRTM